MELETKSKEMEEKWLQQASDGDLDAFNQLVLKYQNQVYNHALSMLNDGWKADEAVQDSFLKAFQNIRNFHGTSFRAWLMRIVTNTAYDMLRQTARRPVQPLFPEDEDGDEMDSPSWLVDPSAYVESNVERGEQTQMIYQALNDLKDVYRDVIILIDLQDFDYEEAAQSLNIPIGTVKSRLARARMQMKEKLRANQLVMIEERQILMQNPI